MVVPTAIVAGATTHQRAPAAWPTNPEQFTILDVFVNDKGSPLMPVNR